MCAAKSFTDTNPIAFNTMSRPLVGLDDSGLGSPEDFLAHFLGNLCGRHFKARCRCTVAVVGFEAIGVVMRVFVRRLRCGEWGMTLSRNLAASEGAEDRR